MAALAWIRARKAATPGSLSGIRRLAVLLALAATGPALAGAPPPAPSESSRVASTPAFVFHSDFWHNLHDYLFWRAQDDGPAGEASECIAALAEDGRLGWSQAESFYKAGMGERHHRRDPLMRAIRYRLSGLADLTDPGVPRVFDLLRAAAPAYEACFWPRQDAANRARVGALMPHLITLGPEIQSRLERLYQEPWPEAVRVDVVPYGSWAGANTASGRYLPPHMQFSSLRDSTDGLSGLELLMHEATHEIFGSNHGKIGEAIVSLADSKGRHPPRDLWHALSFYTSGHVMEEIVAETDSGPYRAYWRRGVMNRAWPRYLEPLEEHWRPYLEGQGTMRESLARLVEAILAASEATALE